MLLEVETDGSTRRARSGETDDDAAARRELGIQALVRGHGPVKVGVREVTGISDRAT